jgi:Ring finger domain
MAERLLYKNSCNLSALIHLLTLHEESTSRYIRYQNTNDNNIVNLLTTVFTNNQMDMSGNSIRSEPRNETLVFNDNSCNPQYLDEMRYGDLSYCIYTTCPISREAFSEDSQIIKIKSCGHYFKKNAIIPWLTRSTCCPYCRSNIVESIRDERID